MTKYIIVVIVLALASLSAAGCGTDPTPTPTPTPTATPTPVPPTPTPTSAPTGTGSAEGLVITASTTGQELMDRLSVEERDCVRETFGDAVYNIMLQIPLAQGTADPAAAAPLYNCMTFENILHVGVAFISFAQGGWTPETVACTTDIVRDHPAIVTDSLGITGLPTEPADAIAKHRHIVLLYECQNVEERARGFAQNQIFFDSFTTFENGLMALLPQSELDCIQDGLSAEEFAALSEHSLLSAFDSSAGDTLTDCISDESFSGSFLVIMEAMLMGSMTDDTRACLIDFAGNNRDYVGAAKVGYYDFEKIPVEEYVALSNAQFAVFNCLTDEELVIMQNTTVSAVLGP